MVLVTDADTKQWLPGDNLYDNALFIPLHFPAGAYDLQIGIVDPQHHQPRVQLAIEGKESDGWYTLGNINIEE